MSWRSATNQRGRDRSTSLDQPAWHETGVCTVTTYAPTLQAGSRASSRRRQRGLAFRPTASGPSVTQGRQRVLPNASRRDCLSHTRQTPTSTATGPSGVLAGETPQPWLSSDARNRRFASRARSLRADASGGREGEEERCTFARRAFDPNATAVGFDDAACDSEAEAGAAPASCAR